MAMNLRIVDKEEQDNRYGLFDVHFHTDVIKTTVTSDPDIVTHWIFETESSHSGDRRLIVGLDVEWRPNFHRNQQNPVAVLQICVDHRCLIIQLLYCRSIPESLDNFLGNRDYDFVGVGIESDVEKLLEDYELNVKNTVGLGEVAADAYGMRNLRNAGLKKLCNVVLGKEITKPKSVTMGRWDSEWLSSKQIQYACLDAFVSSEIARHLNVGTGAAGTASGTGGGARGARGGAAGGGARGGGARGGARAFGGARGGGAFGGARGGGGAFGGARGGGGAFGGARGGGARGGGAFGGARGGGGAFGGARGGGGAFGGARGGGGAFGGARGGGGAFGGARGGGGAFGGARGGGGAAAGGSSTPFLGSSGMVERGKHREFYG